MDIATGRYDAQKDAAALAAPLKKWARLGFLRGFSGIRKEMLPLGQMSLPSKAFSEVAWESLSATPADTPEYKERHRYVMEVEEILAQRQTRFVEDHIRNFFLGKLCDIFMALVFAALMIGLVLQVGAFSGLTLCLFALIFVKIFYLHVSVRRALGIAQAAFQCSRDDVRLPWASGDQPK
jgi:hypothetical protein|nr:hypothetical protein [Neorhizobium tomejilense]